MSFVMAAGPAMTGRNYVPGLVVLNTVLLLFVVFGSQRPSISGGAATAAVTAAHAKGAAAAGADASCADTVAGMRVQLERLLKLRVAYGEMYCKQHGIGPTGGFCVKKDEKGNVPDVGGNAQWDAPVCTRMAELFAGASVLDFGCGMGWYGRCLTAANKGIKWVGMDGSEGIENVTGGR